MPFRAIAKMTEGMVDMKMVDGILLVVNGRTLQGLSEVITGFLKTAVPTENMKRRWRDRPVRIIRRKKVRHEGTETMERKPSGSL